MTNVALGAVAALYERRGSQEGEPPVIDRRYSKAAMRTSPLQQWRYETAVHRRRNRRS